MIEGLRRESRTGYKRERLIRDPRDRFLIVCEGEKTEPQYFEGYHLPNVKALGFGDNTDNLVKIAIDLKIEAEKRQEKYDQVWCVFDRDDFPAKNFNNALILARQYGINIAYSNEAFELWYLLHFNYYDSALSRADYINKLDGVLGFKYEKNSPKMFEELIDKQEVAIRNAERLLAQYQNHNPEKDNPATTVHKLVQEINKSLNTK